MWLIKIFIKDLSNPTVYIIVVIFKLVLLEVLTFDWFLPISMWACRNRCSQYCNQMPNEGILDPHPPPSVGYGAWIFFHYILKWSAWIHGVKHAVINWGAFTLSVLMILHIAVTTNNWCHYKPSEISVGICFISNWYMHLSWVKFIGFSMQQMKLLSHCTIFLLDVVIKYVWWFWGCFGCNYGILD